MIRLLVPHKFDVGPLHWAIRENPHLWNEHTQRTESPESPHHGLDDIWLRFGAPEEGRLQGSHESHWYPAADVLPVKDICDKIMKDYDGRVLGGVLLTRIRAGKECRPHIDNGWHAREYEKFAVQIESAPGQKFHFEESELESRPGDLYTFDNAYLHWVRNPTEYDRITLIVCIKR
jgi:hypothetical protein